MNPEYVKIHSEFSRSFTEIWNKSRPESLPPRRALFTGHRAVSQPAHAPIADVQLSSPQPPSLSGSVCWKETRMGSLCVVLKRVSRDTCPKSAKKCQISYKFYLSYGNDRGCCTRFLAYGRFGARRLNHDPEGRSMKWMFGKFLVTLLFSSSKYYFCCA